MLNQLQQVTSFANSVRATAALSGMLLIAANWIILSQPLPKTARSTVSLSVHMRTILSDGAFMVAIGGYVAPSNIYCYYRYIDSEIYSACLNILGMFFPCTVVSHFQAKYR